MNKIGVLAIQGDFERHKQMVLSLGYEVAEVRSPKELSKVDKLIIPGGESTTIIKLLSKFQLVDSIKEFGKKNPVLGTCAGLIILSHSVDNLPIAPLNLIDIHTIRNAYGRQKESFIDEINLNLNGSTEKFMGVFIRAPKIIKYGTDVNVLGTHKNDVVMASSGNVLVCTFHPELSNDLKIHSYFIEEFNSN